METIEIPVALIYDAIRRLELTHDDDNLIAALVLRRRIGADIAICVACGSTFAIEHPRQSTCIEGCEG